MGQRICGVLHKQLIGHALNLCGSIIVTYSIDAFKEFKAYVEKQSGH